MPNKADKTAEVWVGGTKVSSANPMPIIAGGAPPPDGGGRANESVELWVNGAPVSNVNPIPVSPAGGGAFVSPGSGSASFTPGSVLIADGAGAINETTGLTFSDGGHQLTIGDGSLDPTVYLSGINYNATYGVFGITTDDDLSFTAGTGKNIELSIGADTILHLDPTVLYPVPTTNTVDLGSTTKRFKTGYFGTSVITPSATLSGLTAGRVVYAGTGGLLSSDAGMTYNGTSLSVTGPVLAAAGSSAAPSYSFTGNPTVGLWDNTASDGRTILQNAQTAGQILALAGRTTTTGGNAIELRTLDGSNVVTTRLAITGHSATASVTLSAADLLFGTDNARDIGASGATRPRTGYFGTSLLVGTAGTYTGATLKTSGVNINVGTDTAHGITFFTNAVDKWTISSSGHFIAATDNTYDIGASGATRPRTGYFGTSMVIGPITYTGVGLSASGGNSILLTTSSGGDIYFQAGGSSRWWMQSDGHLKPFTTNTYDLGTSSVVVRTGYFGTGVYAYTATTPAAALVGGSDVFRGFGDGATSVRARLGHFDGTAANAGRYVMQRGRGTAAAPTIVQSGDALGIIVFQGYDSGGPQEAALICAEVDGTPGSSDMPGRLMFLTTPDGSATPTERLRITSTGAAVFSRTGYAQPASGIISSAAALYVNSDDGSNESAVQIHTSGSTNPTNIGSTLAFSRSRGTSAAPTVVASGDRVANIAFDAFDGSNRQNLAAIRAYVDGTPGTNDMPGRILFLTTPDGSATLTENIRISSTTQYLWVSPAADNTTAVAGIAFGSSRDTMLYRSAAGQITFGNGTTNPDLTFDSSGTGTGGLRITASRTELYCGSGGADDIAITAGGGGRRVAIESRGTVIGGSGASPSTDIRLRIDAGTAGTLWVGSAADDTVVTSGIQMGASKDVTFYRKGALQGKMTSTLEVGAVSPASGVAILGVYGTPTSSAHILLGEASASDGVASAQLLFAGNGVGHHSISTIPSTTAATRRMKFAYGTSGAAKDYTGYISFGGDDSIFFGSGTDTKLYRAGSADLRLTGHFTFTTDNTYDIGASGATRPRIVYIGTRVEAPAAKFTTGAVSGYVLTSDGSGNGTWSAPAEVTGRMVDLSDGAIVTVKYANGVATASGDNVVLAAVTGKKIRVTQVTLQVQETGTVTARFQDNATATNRSMPFIMTASADGTSQQAFVAPTSGGGAWFETAEGVGLDLNLSAATDVGWQIAYVEVE